MKKTYLITLAFILSGLIISCDESFLDKKPVGAFGDAALANAEGVTKALYGAYSYLNGGGIGMWMAGILEDLPGVIRGGEATKGSSAFDMNEVNDFVGWKLTTGGGFVSNNFNFGYTGVDRCNIVMKLVELSTDLTDDQKDAFRAEARFLRGLYYFHLKKNYYNVPWLDETTVNTRVPNYEGDPGDNNYVDIWPSIIADFQFAADELPPTQTSLGRVNSWAAKCFLAKAKLYAGTYDPTNYPTAVAEALVIFNDAIADGVTSKGDAYALVANYHDNFDAAYEHNSEYVFGVELSTLDGDADGFFNSPNANQGGQFWGMWRDGTGPDKALGWGFYQATEWFANHFRTDANGLPYLDMFDATGDYTYSSDTLADDYGLDPAPAAFTVDTQGVDPRLDWSLGRRGINYMGRGSSYYGTDGNFPGSSWIRAQLEGGPYEDKKTHVWKDQVGVYVSLSNCYPSINIPLMRYSDVLLMTAECVVRTGGSLETARDLVNEVRDRMVQNSSSERHYVKKIADGTDAANYRIGTWEAGLPNDPFTTTAGAMKAILYERTLELGFEGTRFYDLQRFGVALDELTKYMAFEKSLKAPAGGVRYGHYTADFLYEEPKDKLMPIPTPAIDRSKVGGVATLIQNPGY